MGGAFRVIRDSCELHGELMTENGDWLVGVRGCYWPKGKINGTENHCSGTAALHRIAEKYLASIRVD